MATPPSNQVEIRRQQLLRLFAVLIIAAGATILTVVGLAYYSAKLIDEASLQQETLQVTRRVDSTLVKMHNDVRSAAVWSDAHAKSLAHDANWLHENIGKYFSDYMSYPVSVVFSPDGRPIYASRDSNVVAVSREAQFIAAVAPMVRAVRDESIARNSMASDHRAYGFTAHIAHEGMVLVGGSPYFVAVSNIVPEDAAHRDSNAEDPLVATGQRVTSIIPRLSEDLALLRPRLVLQGTAVSGPFVTLSAPDGAPVGKISWQASRPGGRLIIDAAPTLVIVILVALAALFAGMVRIRRLFVDLVDHETALDVSRREAEEANLAKTRFLANMSHELRTPLNGIIAMSEMLHQQQTDLRGREMTRTVVASGRILERVLNDILDVAKIEAIEVEFERVPFDMDGLLLDVAALHRATAEAKGLQMELNITPGAAGTYVGDHVRVSQVISNLLSNAVKFTDHGRVAITARRCSTGLHLVVSDTGQGFDRATSDRLFKRFEQGDSSINRRHGGTGLGLWISRALVRAMGGTIRVRSIVGKGTLFSVQLPLERIVPHVPSPLEAEPERQDRHEDGWPPLRVLVAEDHEVNQRVMMMILDTIGAKVTLAENGALAVEAFKDTDFDVILMDIQMPIMDGLVAIAKIRELEIASGASRTPIIAVTANAMAADREASMKAGADDHLSKPVRPAALIEALSELLMTANDQKVH